jgi:glycosyltransferase involved in cell wall biosynthesis
MISVIIPTYNRAEYLKEAIQSVLGQDYFQRQDKQQRFEIIVVDDGSTDTTEDIVRSLDCDIQYIYQKNRGVSAARNVGLEHSKGEFIAYLDSDDLWKKDKIAVQMSLLSAVSRAMMCYTEEIWIRNSVFVNPKKRHKKYSGWIFDKVLPLCLISLSSALFRREIFDEVGLFDENLPVCEDYDFGIRLAHKYPVYFLTRPLIIKRGGHKDQLSHKYWGMDRFRIMALEKALSMELSPAERDLVRAEIVKKSRVLINGFEKRGNISEADKYRKLMDYYTSEGDGS